MLNVTRSIKIASRRLVVVVAILVVALIVFGVYLSRKFDCHLLFQAINTTISSRINQSNQTVVLLVC